MHIPLSLPPSSSLSPPHLLILSLLLCARGVCLSLSYTRCGMCKEPPPTAPRCLPSQPLLPHERWGHHPHRWCPPSPPRSPLSPFLAAPSSLTAVAIRCACSAEHDPELARLLERLVKRCKGAGCRAGVPFDARHGESPTERRGARWRPRHRPVRPPPDCRGRDGGDPAAHWQAHLRAFGPCLSSKPPLTPPPPPPRARRPSLRTSAPPNPGA